MFLKAKWLRVHLKGGDQWRVPIGRRTATALDRYLRARARHRACRFPLALAGRAALADRGEHFTDTGIRQMLERRGEQAGIQNVQPAPVPSHLRR